MRILLLLLITISCASKERTKYQAYDKKQGGYQDKVLEDGLRSVLFKANSETKKKLVYTFAEFRAIEICSEESFKVALFMDELDKSESKTIQHSSTSAYPGYGYIQNPSYYYGMPPFYNHYSGLNYGIGVSTMSGRSWDETLQFPEIEVLFKCANESYGTGIELREVTPDELKLLVKDLRGGLQVEKMSKDSVNQKVLFNGDIIIRVQGERVQKMFQFLAKLSESKDHHLRLDIIRDGNFMNGLLIKRVDNTDLIIKHQNEIIKSACKNKEVKKRKLCH